MRQSGVGLHVRNLLIALNNHLITKQRPDESQAAQRGRDAVDPQRIPHLLKSLSRMCFAVRKLSAAMVSVGLAVAPVGNVLLPTR